MELYVSSRIRKFARSMEWLSGPGSHSILRVLVEARTSVPLHLSPRPQTLTLNSEWEIGISPPMAHWASRDDRQTYYDATTGLEHARNIRAKPMRT